MQFETCKTFNVTMFPTMTIGPAAELVHAFATGSSTSLVQVDAAGSNFKDILEVLGKRLGRSFPLVHIEKADDSADAAAASKAGAGQNADVGLEVPTTAHSGSRTGTVIQVTGSKETARLHQAPRAVSADVRDIVSATIQVRRLWHILNPVNKFGRCIVFFMMTMKSKVGTRIILKSRGPGSVCFAISNEVDKPSHRNSTRCEIQPARLHVGLKALRKVAISI